MIGLFCRNSSVRVLLRIFGLSFRIWLLGTIRIFSSMIFRLVSLSAGRPICKVITDLKLFLVNSSSLSAIVNSTGSSQYTSITPITAISQPSAHNASPATSTTQQPKNAFANKPTPQSPNSKNISNTHQ